MTLNLQMLATLDAKGVEQGAAEARREIGRLGKRGRPGGSRQ